MGALSLSLLVILSLPIPAQASHAQQVEGPYHLYLPAVLMSADRSVRILTTATLSQTIVVRFGDGILYTHDGTRTWNRLALPYTAPGNSTAAVALRDDPAQPSRILVALESSYALYGPVYGAIYRTGDFGATWDSFNFPLLLGCERHAGFTNLVTSPVDPKRLYVRYYCLHYDNFDGYVPVDQPYTSANGGLTWQPITKLGYLLQPSASIAQRLYSASLNMDLETFFWESDDAGVSWTRTFSGPNSGILNAAVVVDSVLPDVVYTLAPSIRYSDLEHYRLLRSENFGQSWPSSPAETPCKVNRADGSSGGGLYYATDQLIPQLGKARMLFLRCNFAATTISSTVESGALFRSSTGGDTWDKLTAESGEWLAVDAGNPGRLLWLRDDVLWLSSDDGTSWTPASPKFHPCANC